MNGLATSEDRDYLDYMHARYYNPNLGRFLSVDPEINRKASALPQRWNRYAYGGNNPIRLIDPDGRSEKDALSIYRVQVNIVYSNADNKIRGGSETLRQVTEKGISEARNFFAQAGVALSIQRYAGNIADGPRADGPVKTPTGERWLSDFVASQKGITVLVSGDIVLSGATDGLGGPTRIGNLSSPTTLTDELAHALGNTPPVGNTLADLWTDLNEFYVDNNLGLAPAYEQTIRNGASHVGCMVGGALCTGK